MKIQHILFIFVCLALVGLTLALIAGDVLATAMPDNGSPAVVNLSDLDPDATATLPYTAPNGQRNLLVIGVDDLGSESPNLVSAWLALYIPPAPSFTMLPIYPAENSGLDGTASLDPEKAPSESFRAALAGKGIWWHNYVVLDQAGITEIIGLLSSSAGKNVDASLYLTGGFPSSQPDPAAVLQQQWAVIDHLCVQSNRLMGMADIGTVFNRLSGRYITDFDLQQARQEWTLMIASGGQINCNFPTLAGSPPTLETP